MCGKCGYIYYCSITCQAQDWNNHINYCLIGLMGELGEFANKYKKMLRGDYKLTKKLRGDLMCESGDILWYLSLLVDELGYNLSVVAKNNINKLRSRQERSMIHGSGDNR